MSRSGVNAEVPTLEKKTRYSYEEGSGHTSGQLRSAVVADFKMARGQAEEEEILHRYAYYKDKHEEHLF